MGDYLLECVLQGGFLKRLAPSALVSVIKVHRFSYPLPSAVPRKDGPDPVIDSVDVDGGWGGRGYSLGEQTRPQHRDIANREGATDEGPVRLEEAEHAAYDDIRAATAPATCST